MPTVSVIIPAYNAEATITRALQSAVAQTHRVSEIIVVDDCSNDGTADAVRKFVTDIPVRIVSLPVNGGPSRARNVGLGLAAGDWIALLDADDAWLPDRMERLLELSDAVDVVADDVLAYDFGTSEIVGRFCLKKTFSGTTSLRNFLWQIDEINYGYLKPLMRRNLIINNGLAYDEGLRSGEDYIFYTTLLCAGGRLLMVDYAGYIYTTQVGPKSGARSPFSHTQVDNENFAHALLRLRSEYSPKLSRTEVDAINRRVRHLKSSRRWEDFKVHLRNARYYSALQTFALNPLIFTFARRYMLRKVFGVKDFMKIDKHWLAP